MKSSPLSSLSYSSQAKDTAVALLLQIKGYVAVPSAQDQIYQSI